MVPAPEIQVDKCLPCLAEHRCAYLTFLPYLLREHYLIISNRSSLSLLLLLSARKLPDRQFWVNIRVLFVVKVSEMERKRTYVCQGCPKGTTKAINRASCLVSPINYTHSNYLHMHAPYSERSRKRISTLAID